MADEALMDVFINILPDKDLNAHIDGMVDAAMARIREKFGSAAPVAIKSPLISSGTSGGGGRVGRSSAVAQDADAAKELADRYREAVRAAEDATTATRKLGVAIKSIGNTGLSSEFETARLELNGILTDIRRGAADKDPLALDESLKRLILIQNQLDAIRSKSGPALAIRQQFEDTVAGERNQRGEFRIESRLQQSLTRGQPSGQLRHDIAKATAEVQRLEREFDELVAKFDGSAAHLDRLNTKFRQLNVNSEGIGARSGVRALQSDAARATTSMNQLSNNAYQLGQAFEDAAVGFQLNGVAGAVRGASNNVSFLINNLVQAKAAAGQLTGAFASKIPLIAGIAVALGLIAPTIIDWLESLNDVDLKFEDISDRIKENFANQEFRIGLDLEERNFIRAIQSAKDLDEILNKVKDTAQKVGDENIGIKSSFEGLDESADLSDILNKFRELNGLAEERRKILKETLSQPVLPPGAGSPLIKSLGRGVEITEILKAQEELKNNTELANRLTVIYDGLRSAREDALSGKQPDSAKILSTVSQFRETFKDIGPLIEAADLMDPKATESLTKSFKAIEDVMNTIGKGAQRIENFNQELTGGLDAAILKTKEFAAAQDIVRKQIDGTAGAEALFIFNAIEASKENAKKIELIREALLDQQKDLGGGDIGKINAQADELRSADIVKTRIEFLQKEKEIRDKISAIKEKDKKSDSTQFESFASNLQRNVLSSDKKSPLKDFERDLREVIQGRRSLEEQAANRRGVFARENLADKTNPFNEPLMRELFKTLTDEMKNTTGAVKKVDITPRAAGGK